MKGYVGSMHGHELSQGFEHYWKMFCAIRTDWQMIVAVWDMGLG